MTQQYLKTGDKINVQQSIGFAVLACINRQDGVLQGGCIFTRVF
jgi:hypothetical protein